MEFKKDKPLFVSFWVLFIGVAVWGFAILHTLWGFFTS